MTTEGPKKVEVYQTEAELESALAKEQEQPKLPAVLPGGLDLERLGDLAHLDDEGKASAQGVIIGVSAMGVTKAASKLFNHGKPLSPGAAAAAGVVGSIGGGVFAGLLFGKGKRGHR